MRQFANQIKRFASSDNPTAVYAASKKPGRFDGEFCAVRFFTNFCQNPGPPQKISGKSVSRNFLERFFPESCWDVFSDKLPGTFFPSNFVGRFFGDTSWNVFSEKVAGTFFRRNSLERFFPETSSDVFSEILPGTFFPRKLLGRFF